MEDDNNVNDQSTHDIPPMLPLFPQCSEDSVVDAEPISYCLPRHSSNSTITADFPFMSPAIHDDDANSPIFSPFPQVLGNPSNPTLSLFPENPSEPTLSLFSQVSKTPKEHSLSLFPQVSDDTPPPTTTQSSAPPLSTDLCLSLPYTLDITSSTTLTLPCSIGSHHSSAKRSLFQESREEKFVPPKKIKVTEESRNGQHSIVRPAAVAAEGEEGHWIIKTLKMSDVNGASRLLLGRQEVKKYVLPFMAEEQQAIICNDICGVNVTIYDMDTDTEHILTIKKWATDSFILVKAWTMEFVKRRNLKKGDIIWIRWEKNNSRFCFRVHMRNQVDAV